MIGNGKNKKSIAYIENCAAFLEYCIDNKVKPGLYNYSDTPSLDMNTLVKIIMKQCYNSENIGFRFPYFLALVIGYFADFLSKIFRRKFLISSLRIRKFCAFSEFGSDRKEFKKFIAPVALEDAIVETFNYEFPIESL